MKTESKPQYAAIEFGTSKIVTIIGASGGTDRINIVGSGTVPYDGFSDGDWNTPRQMVRKIRDSITAAEMEAGSKIKELYIGVPGEYIRVLTTEVEIDIPDGQITGETFDILHDVAADQLGLGKMGCLVLHRSPAWYSVDDGEQTLDVTASVGSKLKGLISFIIADPNFVEDMKVMMGVLDITILGFLSTTLGEALLLHYSDRDSGAVLIDVGYLNTEISAVRGDAITYHAVLPQGGGYVTRDLAEGLQIDMRSAERIKREFSLRPDRYDKDSFSEVQDSTGNRRTFPREMVAEIIEARIDEILNMVDMTLKNDVAPLLTPTSRYMVTGGGFMMQGEQDYLKAKLGEAIVLMKVQSPRMNSPVFASATGLMDLILTSFEEGNVEEEKTGGFLGFFKK